MRRRIVAFAGLGILALIIFTLLVGSRDGEERDTANVAREKPKPPAPIELPRGGRSILPENRIVAFYGAPQDVELGELGIGKPNAMARRLTKVAGRFKRQGRPVLPALELITVIANAHPGDDGTYRTRQQDEVIRRYLRTARRHKMLLVLDIQPGRADFFKETTRLERWLREPDVGLALDPEWRVEDGEVPGKVIGSVAAREVNATSAWLEKLVAEHELPEKLFIVHQFTEGMVDPAALKPRKNLATVLNIDGFGTEAAKVSKYREFTKAAPQFAYGFKLFYREDDGLMSPKRVMRLRPQPDVIVYE